MTMDRPSIDAKPGEPETYYFDEPTRERVLAKQKALKAVEPESVKKTAKKATKKR